VTAYLIRRFLLIIPTFIGISIVTFLVLQLIPGNPVFQRLQAMRGAMGAENISPEIIEQTKKLYGLDKPIHVRYIVWMGKIVRLDFGDSFNDGRPVTTRIRESLPVTLQMNILSLIIMYAVSIPLGIFSATHQHTRRDSFITFILFILYSLPSFWVAMLLMYFFCGGSGSNALSAFVARGFTAVGLADAGWVKWLFEHVLHFRWFPIYGASSDGAAEWPFHRWLADRLWHFVLPVFCLTYSSFAIMSRYARAGMIEVVRQDYIRTARAYGFTERAIVYKYALRNSLIPLITIFGSLLPGMIAGSVIIESIFSVNGMGRLFYDSIMTRDYSLVMGLFTFTALLTMFGMILSDVLYALVDPRIAFK
jgi:peptide/nickel transport system permease protein